MNLRGLLLSCLLLMVGAVSAQTPQTGRQAGWSQCWQWVDPRIGSVGVGRTFPGPSMPFGMVKPGPDCGVLPNAGWAPMPEAVCGFSQTHVSGTGGGQKYGNILLQPFLFDATELESTEVSHDPQKPQWPYLPQHRLCETINLGYYSTTYEDSIRTEITTNERCAHYRFHFPPSKQGKLSSQFSLLVDATHYLGKDTVPDLRERQQFVDAEVEVTSHFEVQGFSRIRGGWNNGDAYTVYFYLQTDKPFGEAYGNGDALLFFSDTLVNVKVGISYVSTQQARRNIDTHGFDEQLQRLRDVWEQQLQKVHINGTEQQKRMFYTALYHTMLMPVDKTGENPKWTDAPYYDDYYAIWDTYRTSTPLLTLLDPQREVGIVNALLNIYRREGFMPDARSGDCNGRTQGGSNAEVVIADAFAKGLGKYPSAQALTIDYELALEAMLKDGEADPGADHEKHGRGGLNEYRRLGYVPYGIERAGTRTVEYAYCDFCIAQVARGLGRNDIYEDYMKRAGYWRNLWRTDYEWDGMRGFIMPKDEAGCWLDSVVWGCSKVFHPRISYTPVTKVAPWYVPWWSTFFYEATSEEYSLSIPHDVEGLIDACGGPERFRERLDLFFEKGYYNVQNEPSFLTPCLYHFIGRPDLSSQRVRQIVTDHYSDRPDGLPGNDDSGAMSSWLAFHMLGLYPNAGQDYYLLNVPLVDSYTFTLPNGKTLRVSKLGRGQDYKGATLNGREIVNARLTHDELMEGGVLEIRGAKSEVRGAKREVQAASAPSVLDHQLSPTHQILFTLNRQFRTWPFGYQWQGDTLMVQCKQTAYLIPRQVVERGDCFSWLSPQVDGTVYNDVGGTFCFISWQALHQLMEQGSFVYDGITWRQQEKTAGAVTVRADIDGTLMRISLTGELPFVLQMSRNPLGIDWELK